jgi:hypothetical protein
VSASDLAEKLTTTNTPVFQSIIQQRMHYLAGNQRASIATGAGQPETQPSPAWRLSISGAVRAANSPHNYSCHTAT